MHRKPLIAVLAIGLLLMAGTAFAIEGDGDFARVQTTVDKPTTFGPPTALPGDPAIAIQGGTPRMVPGTFCNGEWQGGATYYISGWFWGAEIFAGYQDPAYGMADVFGPGCTTPAYTFDVTAVEMWMFAVAASMPVTVDAQPLTWDADLTNPACPIPGGLLCAGPVYSYGLGGGGAYIFNMAFPLECCVTGPYFASVYWITFFGGGVLENIVDDGATIPPLACRVYDDYGGGWLDMIVDVGFVWNVEIYSEGFTPDDVATHCTPGECDYQWYYPGTPPGAVDDLWDSGYGLRSSQYGGRDKLGVRFEAIGLDTLKSVGFLLYGPFTTDPAPDILVEIWDDGGPTSACGYPTPSGGPLWSTVVPGGSLVFYPITNVVTIPDLTFGTLNGGPLDYFFITITTTDASHAAGLSTGFCAYGTADWYTTGCQTGGMNSLAFYSVYDIPADDPIGDLGPTWVYIGERNWPVGNQHAEFVMEATICAEQIPIVESDCGAGGPDEWPTFAHDYQNTSASSINVGDPNGIKLEWTMPLNGASSFCNPTVAGDVVYISSAGSPTDVVEGFDLATGAPIPGSPFRGIPEMGTSNRGNVTIHNGVVYITGGNFAALSALPAGDLQKTSMLWSNNYSTQGSMDEQNRFGCAMVIDNLDGMGTDVVFVLTEPIAIPGMQGEVYAFDASNGDLYTGWATNPVLLDKAARHGPSYDGTNLYVGTGDADLTTGSIWALDAVTGTPLWQFEDNTIDPVNPGGFPGGVSIDGDYLYAVSADANTAGRRFKLDKSVNPPTVEWAAAQGSRSLYGPPTIGRNFVYIPFDNNGGIGMVDKGIGLQVHNFALQTVGQVSQNVTMSCDNILFAGDRDARWWVLNANDRTAEFYRQYPVPVTGIMNGTALASHSGGDDYAVVGCRYDGSSGRVTAYRLGTGSRPRLEQHEFALEILVPLGASGLAHAAVDDVFENIGDLDLTMGPASSYPTTLTASVRRPAPRADDTRWNEKLMSSGWTSDGEWRISEYRSLVDATTKSGRSEVYTAASASVGRTQNITLNGGAIAVLAPDDMSDLQWDYDQSGLGRGVDVEYISVPNDDPDFDLTPLTSVAEFEVTYQGGCPSMRDTLEWVDGTELMTNVGEWGAQADADNLVWFNDPIDPLGGTLYDGGFYLLWGDSAEEAVRNYMFGEGGDFVGNVAPISGQCGFDNWSGVMGYYRVPESGCPGEAMPITGSMITVSYSDTNMAFEEGNPAAAIGVDIIQTEVGADDPLYGSFKLIRMEYNERNGNDLPGLYAGTFIDWDVQTSYGSNLAALWPTTVKGYALWDEVAPGNAYGLFDPDPNGPLQGMVSIDHNGRGITPGADGLFWNMAVSEAGAMLNDGQGDRGCMLTNGPFDVPANGTNAVHQALFAVDATGGSANEAAMHAAAMNIAARAARWGGWDRGDVNEDGEIDLADVMWLNLWLGGSMAHVIYPDTYNGDVNADGMLNGDDEAYLLAYVSGMGPAPMGAWRF